VKTYQFETGLEARAVEQAVLDWMRLVLDLPPYLSAEVMPQGGWTETVAIEALKSADLVEAVLRFKKATKRIALVSE
jgi:hypothetical protein